VGLGVRVLRKTVESNLRKKRQQSVAGPQKTAWKRLRTNPTTNVGALLALKILQKSMGIYIADEEPSK
jgi:hypothetical protein